MKSPRSLASCLASCFGLLAISSSALAASPPARPADVLAEAASSPPSAELARWERAIGAISPTTTLPTLDALGPSIAKVVGAPGLEGLDLTHSLELVLVNPQKFPQPVVLVAQIGNVKKLTETLAATPALAMRVRKKLVVIGAPAALDLVAEYALSRATTAPPHGIHASAYLQPIYAQFGMQLVALKGLLLSAPQKPGSPITADQMGKLFDGFVDGIQQSNELDIDIDTPGGAPEATFTLVARPGTAVDGFYAKQKPSDFSLLGKLASAPMPMLAAGNFNMPSLPDFFVEWMLGKDEKNAQSRAEVQELLKLMSGEIAMGGVMFPPEQMQFQQLFGTRDLARTMAIMPHIQDAMSRSGMLDGKVKVARTEKPGFSHEGVKVIQSEIKYDFTQMPSYKEKPVFSKANTLAGWDNLIGSVLGADAASVMRQLITAARNGTGALTLTPAMRASLDRARTAKESFWMRMDMASMAKSASPTPMPPTLIPTVAFGVAGHAGHLRIAFGDPK